MDTRTISRNLADGWLRLARLPIDTAVKLLPNGDRGPRTAVALVVDRADASVRDALGRVLGDDDLRQDARRRFTAADERQKAVVLRIEADRTKAAADEALAEKEAQAAQRREQATRTAEQREEAAERKRAERERQVKESAARRERAVEEQRDLKLDTADKSAKRERLRVLDAEEGALEEQAEALTAKDEALRLEKAATKAKAARKGNA